MIAVVVPTIREESWRKFYETWKPLFEKHDVHLVKVIDGDDPEINYLQFDKTSAHKWRNISLGNSLSSQSKQIQRLLFNKNDGIRNYGFWFVASELADIEYVVTLDDDVLPLGDPIQDHIDTLNKKIEISWIRSTSDYTRGFPYGVRDEAPVMISHGLWQGVADWDAPSQLINGNPEIELSRHAVPKGIYMPFCGMNVAFRREALPYMYYAPMGYKVGMDRFADIWLGINLTRICAEKNWAIYNGGAVVRHERASNVWKNLQKESKGLEINETYWQGNEEDPYFKLYNRKRKQWEKLIKKLI